MNQAKMSTGENPQAQPNPELETGEVDRTRLSVGSNKSRTSLVRLSKSEKKLSRKELTVTDQAAHQLDCTCVDNPTEWVIMWGAGLVLCTKKAKIVQIFDPAPDEVRFYVDRAYCTIHFKTTADAEKAKQKFSGQQPIGSHQTVFLAYLEKEPPIEDPDLLKPFKNLNPEGLTLIPDFINAEDEKVLIARILSMRKKDNGQDLKHRWVRHFGYEFNYDTNNVDSTQPLEEGIPQYLTPLLDRMIKRGVLSRKPEQLTINVYKPGQGIPPHVDTHSAFEAPIVSLSIWADTVMDFRHEDQHSAVILPRRSLLVMNTQARYLWKHGIANRTFDIVPDSNYKGVTTEIRRERISLTFRLIRASHECLCIYSDMCDTQQGKITEEMAERLEKELVHNVYEEIASHFSSTRRTPWPKVKEFVQSIAPGNTMLDVGCGNGKYFDLAEYVYQVGTDMSSSLLDIARRKASAEGIQSNCMHLPFKDNSFDFVICIAVLHHLCTEDRRMEAINELLRVMRPNGQGLIYVWAKDQRFKEVKSAYARQREFKNERYAIQNKCAIVKNYSFLPVHEHEADFPQKDMLVPWIKINNNTEDSSAAAEVHHRYYHVFERGELDILLKKAGTTNSNKAKILDTYYDQGNWCVKFEKTSLSSKSNEFTTTAALEESPTTATTAAGMEESPTTATTAAALEESPSIS